MSKPYTVPEPVEGTLPRGWARVRLGDIVELKYGKSLAAAARSAGPFPVFGSNGQVGTHRSAITTGPTIVVGRKGSLGAVNYSDGPCWPIDTTYYVDLTATAADLRWLAYRMADLGLTAMNRAAAVPGLNREDAYRLPVLLPPLPEQRRIAAILDAADALRAKRRATIAALDTLTQSIFLDMFGDPFSNPMGWPELQMGAVAVKFSDGPFGSNLKTSDYAERGVRVIRLQNIGSGRFIDDDRAFISEPHFAKLQKHLCRPGDVLVGTLGDPNLRACLQPDWLGEAINKADCVQIRVDFERATAPWLVGLINSPGTLARAQSRIQGQTRLRVSMGRLRELLVPVPPLRLQEQFGLSVARVEGTAKAARHSLGKLDLLFASLQCRAFRGEL